MSFALPYIIVAILLLFFYLGEIGKIKGLSAKVAVNSAYLLMLLFVGLRGFVLTDFVNYFPLFQRIPVISKLQSFHFFAIEPGFVIYTSIIKTLGFNYFDWVLINTFIDFLVFRHFFKLYSPSQVLPLICMMAFNGILIEFNLYRNIKAIELFLLSFPFLLQRKFIPYLILNLIGLSFHNSAIIYLPLYFILTIRLNKMVVWGLIAIANIIFLCRISVISNIVNSISFMEVLNGYDKLMTYSSIDQAKGLSIGFLERTFSIFTFTLLRDKLIHKHHYYNSIYNCYLIYYLCFLIFYEVPVFLQRIPILFVFSYWILYPSVIYIHYRWRKVINFAITILLALKIYTSHTDPYYQYQNILWSDVNYNKSLDRVNRLNLI